MGRRGPQAAPAALKLLRGNPGHRPIKEGVKLPPHVSNEPDWESILPGDSSPDNLMVRGDASAKWNAVVPQLEAHGLLARVDETVVVEFCICSARIAECEREISRHGLMVESERGWVRNPCCSIANSYRSHLRFYVGALGLSPAARSDLKSSTPTSEDDAGSILD